MTLGNWIDKVIEDSLEAEARRCGMALADYKEVQALEIAERQAASKREEEEKRRLYEEQVIHEANLRLKLGQKLGLGVPVHIGNVTNVGGLTQRSAGNGMTKASVYHVVLNAPYVNGRLIRKEGDLLCKPAARLASGSLGLDGYNDFAGPADSLTLENVTCRKCSDLLSKIKR